MSLAADRSLEDTITTQAAINTGFRDGYEQGLRNALTNAPMQYLSPDDRDLARLTTEKLFFANSDDVTVDVPGSSLLLVYPFLACFHSANG